MRERRWRKRRSRLNCKIFRFEVDRCFDYFFFDNEGGEGRGGEFFVLVLIPRSLNGHLYF